MSDTSFDFGLNAPLIFDPKIIISCVTKDKGPLTKIMSLHPETGQVVKDGSECSMHSGFIKQIPISSPEGFAKMLASRKENQAIVHGICEHKEARVVTKGQVGKVKHDLPVIARAKEFIAYADGPGVIMFDHDKAREGAVGSDEALASYSPEHLIKVLATVHPEIGRAAYVSTPSTSSCIYNAAGEMLRGEGTGSHTYLFVKKASDIPRYLKVLGQRLFLAGLGRIEVSRSGSLLERTLVDLLVGSPERLDFVAGAVCRDGLEQRLPAPTVHDGDMLDTSTLPDLTTEEEQRLKDIVAALKHQAKPHQEKVVAVYIECESVKLAAAVGITIEEARRVVESRQDHILEDGDILFFAHLNDGVTVASVLDAGESFHNKSLADPLEPDYEGGSKTKAKFFWNDGNPIIHSYAHGSVKYRFRRFVGVAKGESHREGDLALLTLETPSLIDPIAAFDGPPPEKEWHVQGLVPAGCTVVANGQGGTSKSTTILVMCAAIASGRDIGPFRVDAQGKRVLLLNVEDGADDLQRTLHYLNKVYQFTAQERAEIAANLIVFPGRGLVGSMLVDTGTDGIQPTIHGQWLMDSLDNIKPAVVVLDTKSRTYGLDENSNSHNTAYVSFFEGYLPKNPRTTFLIIHHNSKERAGDGGQSSARGGSALIDNARGNLVFTAMTEAEAEQYKVSAHDYFWMSNAKNNYAAKAGRVCFRRRKDAGGIPEMVNLDDQLRSAALDTLVELLVEHFPEGIGKRDLVRGDKGAEIRKVLKDEHGVTVRELGLLIQYGIDATRLDETPDIDSKARGDKPLLVKARMVATDRNAPPYHLGLPGF